MSKRLVTCVICGRQFDPPTGNARYCSDDCRAAGANRRRRAWEARTGYLEKKRRHEQERRDAIRAAAEAEKAEAARIAEEARQRKDIEHQEDRRRSIEAAALAGDPFARMDLAFQNGGMMNPAYWEAWRDYDLSYAEASGKVSRTTINGVAVDEPDFPQLVSAAAQRGERLLMRVSHEKAFIQPAQE